MPSLCLKTTDDWDAWINHVQAMSQPGHCPDLWPYIDPSLATQPVEPIAPIKPTIASACTDTPVVTTYVLLNASDRIAYEFSYGEYIERLEIYYKQGAVLHDIWLYMTESVAVEYRGYLRLKKTNWERLVALRKSFAPTDDVRMIKLSAKLRQ